jgi:GT2 family glycosyltransferase
VSVVLDPRARMLDGGRTLLGGDPWRVMRLTETGAAVLRGLLAAGGAEGVGSAHGVGGAEGVGSADWVEGAEGVGSAHGVGGAEGVESVAAVDDESAAAAARPDQALTRRLIDAGLAHPRPMRAPADAATVIIPVRDRAAELERCLSALFATDPPGRVVVVDDGSRDPGAVAAVCARRGCELVRRERSGGPGAARNTALARIHSGVVALLDSDCVPEPGWLSTLCGALAADSRLGAVAPRVRPLGRSRTCGATFLPSRSQTRSVPGPEELSALPRGASETEARARSAPGTQDVSALVRFAAVRSPLDLGPWPSLVRPGGRVAYVPAAALLVRREALGDWAAPFDPALRYGEDVDLVWRMIERGWSVRYAPEAVVHHEEPARLGWWLARRFRYGTSAGPLAHRHPEQLAPVALHPRSVAALVAATAAITTGRPAHLRALASAAPVALHAGLVVSSLSRHGVPPGPAAALALRGLGESGAAVGRAATMLAIWPLAAGVMRPRTRRLALALLLVSPVREYVRLRPALDPLRFAALAIADDVAYGAGVWTGAIRARTSRPLRPRIVRRPRTWGV